jgi:hypothetical protein
MPCGASGFSALAIAPLAAVPIATPPIAALTSKKIAWTRMPSDARLALV